MSDRPSTEAAGPEVFPQARAIFEAVVERPPAERARVVQEACGDSAALRAAVQQMLSADSAPHVLLDGGPVLQTNRWQPGETSAGHYRIVGLMGRGGMGEVYQAHDATLGRDVALKVLPSGIGESDSPGDRLAGGGRAISPDDRWLAYVEIVSGTPQIFVSAFSNPGESRTQRRAAERGETSRRR